MNVFAVWQGWLKPKLLWQVIPEKTMQAFVEMNLKALDRGSKAADDAG